jgi:iron complex outermembrane recepter protein
LRYISDRKASFDDSVGFLQYDIPDYIVADMRAGMSVGTTRFQLYVRNVFDERAQVSVLNTWQGLARPALLQPRTFGVSMTARF